MLSAENFTESAKSKDYLVNFHITENLNVKIDY